MATADDARRRIKLEPLSRPIRQESKSSLRRSSHEYLRSSSHDRRKSDIHVDVRDITSILSVSIQVEGFQFDSSIMEHPEFMITTMIIFQCREYGGKQLETQWKVYRTFQEFQGLDSQLRQRFPLEMQTIPSPRIHRRRILFRRNRNPSFLAKRCNELNAYLTSIVNNRMMRLTRFTDPRAPLVLRCFCNFDAGFGRKLKVRTNQLDGCVLCLDDVNDTSHTIRDSLVDGLDNTSVECIIERQDQLELQEQQKLRQQWRNERRDRHKMDELEANLLDDRARNIVMCSRLECSCQRLSFRVTASKMARILQLHGYRAVYQPTADGIATALQCVLFRLQQINDLDKKLYKLMGDYTSRHTRDTYEGPIEGDTDDVHDDLQLMSGVKILRENLANYGILYCRKLEEHFPMNPIDLYKKLHEFKNRQNGRVGALELVLVSTMLDLSITLVTNDHEGTIQEILPLPEMTPLRTGGRLSVTLGYILPTERCVNGLYILAEQNASRTDDVELPTLWLGLEELDRSMTSLISHEMQKNIDPISVFDYDVADTLNNVILEAVWNDCHHNPKLFNLFQRQARQFGHARSTASFFFQYLEVAFGMEGASYLVDFLLYVLPEEKLRKQLVHARWVRVQRHLQKRFNG